jgi:hypothetical protein
MVEKNEFDNLDTEEPPMQDYVESSQADDSLIAKSSAGVKYNWHEAPDRLKAPPRVDLNGKTVVVTDAEIILPSQDKPWVKTRKGDKEYKYCTFVLHYSLDGQQEFFNGIRVFKSEGNKYSHPSITRDRKTQASELMGLYADYKKKDINEISLKEFMGFLCSKPNATIKSREVQNPVTAVMVRKNFIEKFI